MSQLNLRPLAALVFVCVMSLASACGGGGGDTGGSVTQPPVVQVGTVTVALPAATVQVGASLTAAAEVRSTTGTLLSGRAVSWSSSSAAVAAVSDAGVITGVGAGSVTITGTSEGRSGTASLTVVLAPVNVVALTLPAPTLVNARTMQAAVVLRDERNATLTGRTVIWTSSNPGVATVNSSGLITGVSVGFTTITASAEGKSASADLTVVPPPVNSVEVTLAQSTVPQGGATTAQVVLRDDQGTVLTGRAVAWTTGNPLVASVSSNGTVIGVGVGSTTVTATSEGRSGVTTLEVFAAPVNGVTITLPAPSVAVARTMQAEAELRDERNTVLTGRQVTWLSSNPLVATVSSSGLITGVSLGSVTVTASAEGKSATATLTVTPPAVSTVTVTLAQSTVLQGGSTSAAAVLRDDLGAALAGRVISWSSGNPQVASVSGSGVVTAIGVGSTTIVATSEGRSGSAVLTVNPIPVASVVFNGNLRVKVGDSYTYTITARAADGSILTRPVVWGIRESGKATISQAGVLVPQLAGAFTIVARIDGVEWDASYTAYDWLNVTGSGNNSEVLDGDTQLSNRFGTLNYPQLVVSCTASGNFFLWVRTPHIITQNGVVAFSFDGGSSVVQTWGELSPDFNTLWKLGSNSTVKSFALDVSVARRFFFGFGEFTSNVTKVAQFRVTGLAIRLVPLFTQCPAALKAPGSSSVDNDMPTASEMLALEAALSRRDQQLNTADAQRRAEAGPAAMTSRFLAAWPVWVQPQQNVAKARRR
jgi:uncharacterized protein YjdB